MNLAKFIYIPPASEGNYGKPYVVYIYQDIPNLEGSGWWGGDSSEDGALRLWTIGSPGAFYPKIHCVPYSDFAWKVVQDTARDLLEAKESYKALAGRLNRTGRKFEASEGQLPLISNESIDTQLGLFRST